MNPMMGAGLGSVWATWGGFAVAALGLLGAFGASLAWAGRRGEGGQGMPGRSWHGPALGGLAALAVAGLYLGLGQPRALDPIERGVGGPGSMESMVERLEERLVRDPSDAEGWQMLARSNKVLGRHAEAAAAYERIEAAARRDPDLLADWIEARVLAADQRFDARSRELLAEAVRLAPQHGGVLLMQGLDGMDRGDLPAARRAFTALRDQYEPGSADRTALDEALARLERGQDPRRAAEPSGR